MATPYQYVEYFETELPLSQVGYSARVEYDTTGRSVVGMVLTFKGTSWLIGETSTEAGRQSSPQIFQAKLDAILKALSVPRKSFIWSNGAPSGSGRNVVFSVAPAQSAAFQQLGTNLYSDRRNGPKPRVTGVERIAGGVSAKVSWEIECFVYPAADNPPDCDAFEWAFAYNFDRNFACTRHIAGVYRFRSGTAANVAVTLLPQGSWFPPLPEGFYRDSVSHSLSSDGLELRWSITDKQVWRTLPKPFTSGQSTTSMDLRGATITKTLTAEFEAPVDVDKKTILSFLVAMIRTKFPGAFIPGAPTEYFTGISFTNNDFANHVAMRVTSVGPSPTGTATTGQNVGTLSGLIQSIFGDIAKVTATATGSVQTGTASGVFLTEGGTGATGPGWTPSDGLAELRPMTGTAGLVPVPPKPLDLGYDVTPTSLKPGDVSSTQSGSTTGSIAGPGNRNIANGTNMPSGDRISAAQIAHPYLSFTEVQSWIVRNNLVLLPVLASTSSTGRYPSAIVQQTAPPSLVILQVGHARRLGVPPDVPLPAYIGTFGSPVTDGGARVDERTIRPEAPKLLPDGVTLEYGLSWSYRILVPDVHNMNRLDNGNTNVATAAVRVPLNPQLSDAEYYAGGDAAFNVLSMAPDIDQSTARQPGVSGSGTYEGDIRYDTPPPEETPAP